MPTYEYACKSCGEHLEVVQSFRDDPLTTCPSCRGPLRKVFGAIGIAFKGSGFYKTDSRSSSGGDAKPAKGKDAAAASSPAGSSSSPSSGDKAGSGSGTKAAASS
ncbi:MAG: FmdB family zinc ribbon protein [Acidimicrobiales bacterium]